METKLRRDQESASPVARKVALEASMALGAILAMFGLPLDALAATKSSPVENVTREQATRGLLKHAITSGNMTEAIERYQGPARLTPSQIAGLRRLTPAMLQTLNQFEQLITSLHLPGADNWHMADNAHMTN